MRKLFIFTFLISGFLVNTAFAQIGSSIINPELNIELQPEFPRPGEVVTATLNDYSGGTYGSNVSWVLDGQVVTEASNQRSTQFTAGAVGVNQKIEVVLSKPQGGKEVLERTVKPVYLDIVIEPQTRVPNFYLGRSLPSIGSIVNATALVSTDTFMDSDLVYTWRLNQTVLNGGPIRGLNQVSFTTPRGSEMVLYLQVTDTKGNVIVKRAVSIPSVEPTLKFYEVNQLFGTSHRPIVDSLALIGNSVTVQAEPFNLDSRVYNNPDLSEWKINGVNSGNVGGNPYEVTLQRVGFSGYSNLQFHVRDTTQVLQGARDSIQINF